MKKIKVVHLVDDLKTGGLERIVADMALGIDKAKFDLEVWCLLQGGAIADELIENEIQVQVLNISNYRNPGSYFKLANRLKKAQVDVIHMHGYFSTVLGVFSALISGTRMKISHIHTSFYNLSLMQRFINKMANKFTSKIVYVSQGSLKTFHEAGFHDNSRESVIYNGVQRVESQPAQVPDNQFVLSIVASLTEHKGHTLLLKAIDQLRKGYPQIQLWIIGDGPLREELESEAKQLGIENHVTFLGESSNVPSLLCASKIFVLASSREGMPVSLLEAMAYDNAIVVPEVGGIPEVIEDGKNGSLYPVGSLEELVERIKTLIEDEEKRVRLTRNARATYEDKFIAQKMINNFEELYSAYL